MDFLPKQDERGFAQSKISLSEKPKLGLGRGGQVLIKFMLDNLNSFADHPATNYEISAYAKVETVANLSLKWRKVFVSSFDLIFQI